jgi:hypothetical protein
VVCTAAKEERIIIMKIRSLSILSLSIMLFVTSRADDELPKQANFDRYQKMLDHSPFAVATAVMAPVTTPDVFKSLYIANAAKTPEADLVTVMSMDDKNLKEYLSTAGPNKDGYGIANIEWSDVPGATKVTISKDGKFGTLNFNQSEITAQPRGQPGQPQPQQQQPIVQPANPGNLPKQPARIQALPTPTPHVRGVIPRNPSAANQQVQSQPAEE